MRKALVIPAAALAALLSMASADRADARSSRHPEREKTSAHRPKGSRPSARKSQKTAPRLRSGSRRARTAAGSPGHRRHRLDAPKKAIRQNGRREVVIDRVELVGLPAAPAAQLAGPSRELHNYPPAPCDGVDVVVEAYVHEVGSPRPGVATEALADEPEETGSETLTAEATRSGATASLSRIASRVGSFFRPKSGESQVKPQDVDLTELVSKSFLIPVEGVDAEKLRDSFLSSRGRHAKHLAIDIGAPRGTPILATTDGEIVRITKERRGGNSIYQKDATGQYLLFYCHLSRYADDIEAGHNVKKGDVIGYVGSTGHVIGGPHLHFSITRVPDDGDTFRKGLAINPYLLFLAGVN